MLLSTDYADVSDYEVYESRLLYVTYLRGATLISVVRSLEVSKKSELYRPVKALTKGLDVFYTAIGEYTEMEGGQCEVTIFRCP